MATLARFHGFWPITEPSAAAPDAEITLKSLNYLKVRLDGALVHPGSGQVRTLNGGVAVSETSKHPRATAAGCFTKTHSRFTIPT